MDRKNAFWVVVTVLVTLFSLFVILAAFVQPANDFQTGTTELNDMMNHASRMVWWMTIGLVMLPIMLLLITVAVYLFLTANRQNGNGVSATPANGNGKTTEPQNASEILDTRFARGEITRDQYVSMKKDIKSPRL